MFAQVIRGKVSDASALRERSEAWQAELRPGAKGFLGSTGGVTADGEAVLIARFADRAAAEANGSRPEQGAWWTETERIFDGSPSFADSDDVELTLGGGADGAGFVQIMEGRVDDRDALASFEDEWNPKLQAARPDVIGGVRIWHGEGRFTEAAYFTSESEARAGEERMPDELVDAWQQYMDLVKVERYLDLTEPILT